MSALDGKRVAIVGGGPGGLTLVRLLQQSGADVTVYERDQSRDARVQGSALDLHEDSGLAALEAAGLMDAFWSNYRPDLDRLRLTDAQGRVMYDHARQMTGAGRRPEIERGPLRDILLDSLSAGTVRWNRKLEAAELQNERVLLRFADGQSAVADLVVGCDGANSRLRKLLTPVAPVYVGVSLVEAVVPAAEATVPALWDLLGGAALMAMGNRRTLGMSTKPDGSILLYAGLLIDAAEAKHTLDEAQSPEERAAWFKSNFPGWSDIWQALFRSAASMVLRPLFVCPLESVWQTKPNATLIGDAAHVMPPYAGEGVNMAMRDALVLSRELLSKDDIGSAIAAYEAEMFARMRPMIADTMSNTEMFYAPDAAEQILKLFRSFRQNDAMPPVLEA